MTRVSARLVRLGGAVLLAVLMTGLPLLSAASSASSDTAVSIPSGTGKNPSLNYSPASFTVVVGVNNTIVFTNNDVTYHSVTFTSAPSGVTLSSISIDNLTEGKSFTITLTIPGTYHYHCLYHAWMKGTILVEEPGSMITTPTSTSSSGGGVPEFPSQAVAVTVATLIVVASYLTFVRRLEGSGARA